MVDKVQSFIKKSGINIEQFAVKAGVSSTNIYRFLAGKNITVTTLKKIAKAMDTKIHITFKKSV